MIFSLLHIATSHRSTTQRSGGGDNQLPNLLRRRCYSWSCIWLNRFADFLWPSTPVIGFDRRVIWLAFCQPHFHVVPPNLAFHFENRQRGVEVVNNRTNSYQIVVVLLCLAKKEKRLGYCTNSREALQDRFFRKTAMADPSCSTGLTPFRRTGQH